MTLTLDGYCELQPLRRDAWPALYTATREHDRRLVIARLYTNVGPTHDARIEHEFGVIAKLGGAHVVPVVELRRSGDDLIVIEERRDVPSLAESLAERHGGQALDLDGFFELAIELSAALLDIHAQHVVHRNLSPHSVLLDERSGAVLLSNFGIATLLERARARLDDPELVQHGLPYISPEQSGRTSARVDLRSDLYSLGLIFYELLTGRRPFPADSALELIHAHLARRPLPPQRLRPELPTPVSALVMKLLEKPPERRYQSAAGLAADLAELAAAWRSGRSLDGFEIGTADRAQQLNLPHQLYGRAEERATLLAAFEQAIAGPANLTLLSGPSGVGKSALIDELVEPVLSRRGSLARGPFEAGNEQPFAAIREALSSLADQLLAESENRLELWRGELTEQLGNLAPLAVELVPKLAAVLGASARPSSQSHAEAQRPGTIRHRVSLTLTRLIAAFARPEHPLVLVLDNLQLADAATCELLASLLEQHDRAALALVGTVDGHGPLPGSPLAELVDALARRDVPLRTITLAGLSHAALTQMLSDALALPAARIEPLVTIVARKTDGNPFFVRQLLAQLVESDALRPGAAGWTWDLAALEAAALPGDSGEIMAAKIARLDDAARHLLGLADVIGRGFEAELIAALSAASEVRGGPLDRARVEVELNRLVDAGLLANTASGFVFAHERIREACSRVSPPPPPLAALGSAEPRRPGDTGSPLLSDADKRRAHLCLARLLLTSVGVPRSDAQLLEITEHLDRGHGLLTLNEDGNEPRASVSVSVSVASIGELTTAQLIELTELNCQAGTRALATGAAISGRRYLEIAQQLLEFLDTPDDTLALEVELALALALGLAGEHARAEALMQTALARPLDVRSFGRAALQRCWLLVLAGDRRRALDVGLTALAKLGQPVSAKPSRTQIALAIARFAWYLRPKRLAALEALPPIADAKTIAAIELSTALRNVAYMVEPTVWVVVVARQLECYARCGTHSSMPLVLLQAALVLASLTGNRRAAIELAERSLEHDRRAGPNSRHHELLLLRQSVTMWNAPWRRLLEGLTEVSRLAHEAGDLENATFAALMNTSLSFYAGVNLHTVELTARHTLTQATRWGTLELIAGAGPLLASCRLLTAGSPPTLEQLHVAVDSIPASATDDVRERAINTSKLSIALIAYVFGHHRRALELLDECADELERVTPGTWMIPMLRVVHALAAAARLSETDDRPRGSERRRLQRLLTRRTHQLERLSARGCNFAHLAALLRAECQLQDGALEQAMRSLERARALCEAQNQPIFEAIACERMATLAAARGLDTWVPGPARRAIDCYRRWGTQAKLAQLEARWPELASQTPSAGLSQAEGASTSHAMDVAAILKAWQTIGADIRLEDVVERVMHIAIENAGADRGTLLLPRDGGLDLVSELDVQTGSTSHFDAPLALRTVGDRLPVSLLRWVARTREAVVLTEPGADMRFVGDPYLRGGNVQAALCLPIIEHERMLALLYLENRLNPAGFTRARLDTLETLMRHAASALENAQLYEALRSSELRWRLLVERLPDIVALLDRHGVIEFINHVGTDTDQRTIGRPLLDYVGPSGRAEMAAALREAAHAHGSAPETAEFELEAELPGIGLRWYAARVVSIVSEGRLERILLVATDLSERREREREKLELEAQLRQQQRLESVGTLAAGVAHEINNPVQGIMNYAELIARMPEANDLIREFAGEIRHESLRVATIVRNLLAFSRQERSHATAPVEVAAMIGEALTLIQTIIRTDQIDFEVDIPDGLPLIDCRSQQIQQVLVNLLTNARDALNARYPEHDDQKRVRLSVASFTHDGAPWIRISVEDHGGGVPEHLIDRVFDPFFTTKGRDRGTGLGLSVSHGIVVEHGGQLRLENRPGIGAGFHVELPCGDV